MSLEIISRSPRTYETDEPEIREIHERRKYMEEAWADIREQSAMDIKAASVDPWPVKERAAREVVDNERPCLSFNEIEQHLNQASNEIANQDRAIKVTPEGNGANDKTAELKSDLIRRIEYRSKAPQAYLSAVADAMRGGIGWFRAGCEYASLDSFDQEVVINYISNPWTVFCDPDAKKISWSDMQYLQKFEDLSTESFKRRWPKATIQNFDNAAVNFAPGWVTRERIIIAEDWVVQKKQAKLYNIVWMTQDGPMEQNLRSTGLPKGTQFKSLDNDQRLITLPDGERGVIRRERDIEIPNIVQRMTNGLEILEEIPWKGSWIPFFPVTGREVYEPASISLTGGMKRTIISLVRYARDPQMLYNYFRTSEAEVVGLTPKTPLMVAVGQIPTGQEGAYQQIGKRPLPYLLYNAILDSTGEHILGPPQRQPYEPQIAALEAGAESARRAVMAAMGMNNTSVGRSDTSAKSGVALKELNAQSSMGIWHFGNSMNNAIEQCGRVVEEQLAIRYDAEERELNVTRPDKTNRQVVLNRPDDPESQIKTGDHGVTLSVGKSEDSQRDAVEELAQGLLAAPNTPPPVIGKAIRMMNLGPLANQIADVYDPSDAMNDLPPAVKQKMAADQEKIASLEDFSKQLHAKLESKDAELASKEKIAEDNNITKIVVEEIKQSSQAANALMIKELERLHLRLDGVLKSQLQANQHGHEAAEGERSRAHDGEMVDRQTESQAALQKQAADLAPKPEAGD